MMPAEYLAHPVYRVLTYLKLRQEQADRLHNHWAELHYETVHAFVLDHAFGDIPSPWQRMSPLPNLPVQVKPRCTKYREEMLARPLRRVLHRVDSVVRDAAGIKTPIVVEVLECGHRMPERMRFFDGEKPARRRRCAECATPATMASAKLARRAHA